MYSKVIPALSILSFGTALSILFAVIGIPVGIIVAVGIFTVMSAISAFFYMCDRQNGEEAVQEISDEEVEVYVDRLSNQVMDRLRLVIDVIGTTPAQRAMQTSSLPAAEFTPVVDLDSVEREVVRGDCVICLGKNCSTIGNQGCDHFCLCTGCYETGGYRLQRCPFCRERWTKFERIVTEV